MIAIYIIINLVNGKVYIGSTDKVTDRFYYHKYQLNNGIHHNEHLQRAWNKYGSDSFEFKTLMVCPDNERNHCEQMFIDLYDSQNREFGYNIRDADFHSLSDETKQKISKSLIGRKHSPESCNKMSESHIGVPLSEEHKQKIREGELKPYARIVKGGYNHQGKQQYIIRFNGKNIKQSINPSKLLKWFSENYPCEILRIPKKEEL